MAVAADSAAIDDKATVCLYDGLAVRSEIGKTGKYLSSLSLGETVKWTGTSDKDEAGKEYLKVELSDGKTGWVSANGMQTGARMGAVRDDTPTYKRPDPVTATNQKVAFMTIVAVAQQKDEWLQLVGEGKKQLGWVKKDTVTLDQEDVTNAILATKKLRQKDGLTLEQKIELIAKASPNPGSYFVQKLRERVPAPAVVESTENKENAQVDNAAPAGEAKN